VKCAFGVVVVGVVVVGVVDVGGVSAAIAGVAASAAPASPARTRRRMVSINTGRRGRLEDLIVPFSLLNARIILQDHGQEGPLPNLFDGTYLRLTSHGADPSSDR
jgi:hypothetical protein